MRERNKRLSMSVGNQIKAARLDRGLKQEDLAKMTELSRAQIAQWESKSRNPMMNNFERIAHALGLSVDELMHYRSDPDREFDRAIEEAAEDPIGFRIRLINTLLPALSEKGLDELIAHLNDMIQRKGEYVIEELKTPGT